jgi:hypothetical protein
LTRDGQIVRARSGLHRLILARLLAIPRVPAVVFCVHPACAGRDRIVTLMRQAGSAAPVDSAAPGADLRGPGSASLAQ